MSVLFAGIPVVETGGGSFTEIDVICGLRIASNNVDRTNLKVGRHLIGQSYSMPWSYPDGDLDDLGGPTSIIFTMSALLPAGASTPINLTTTLNASTDSGSAALDDIDAVLQNLLAGVSLGVDTSGLTSQRIRLISLTGDEEPFDSVPVVVELMGQGPAELLSGLPDPAIPDVPLAIALAHIDYSEDAPRPRTIQLPRPNLAAGVLPWLRLSGITKTGDLTPGINIPGLPGPTAFPAVFFGPWNINTTKPAGTDPLIPSTIAISRFNQLLTAGDLNLDESDIPTGWILVHGLNFTFRDGFLELEADLAHTTPAAPNFRLGSFGALRGQVRLEPATFQDRPFSAGTFSNLFKVDVELEWDDNPDSDVEDFDPVDSWFQDVVGGIIRDLVSDEIDSQISAQVEPRIIGVITEELDARRPDNLFTDDGWADFRNQIIAKFFLRFTAARFFGRRTINGVTVVGGLELDALAGSYSNNLALLDIGDGCPGLEVANGFGGFSSFYALSQFRTVVRSDARCSGWNERYLKHRKELVSLVRKNPRLAARIVKTAWAVSPILTDGKNVLDRRGVEATTELAKELKQKASQELARDFETFEKLLDRSAGAGLEDLIVRAAKLVKPTVRQKPQTDQTDSPRIRRKKLSRGD